MKLKINPASRVELLSAIAELRTLNQDSWKSLNEMALKKHTMGKTDQTTITEHREHSIGYRLLCQYLDDLTGKISNRESISTDFIATHLKPELILHLQWLHSNNEDKMAIVSKFNAALSSAVADMPGANAEKTATTACAVESSHSPKFFGNNATQPPALPPGASVEMEQIVVTDGFK
jgi:hypothetical protein